MRVQVCHQLAQQAAPVVLLQQQQLAYVCSRSQLSGFTLGPTHAGSAGRLLELLEVDAHLTAEQELRGGGDGGRQQPACGCRCVIS
jgi:hypothetical protein